MTMLQKLFLLAVAMLIPASAWGQYSQSVFSLRAAADLYDERGYSQGAAITIDGKLAVNNQNGSPAYSYPISSFTSGASAVNVSLNYCGAVQVTAFKDYDLSDRHQGTTYSGWSRFHQSRAMWILGINQWAVNVVSVASHFHGRPGSKLYDDVSASYDDRDLIFLIDGFDFCNRMRDFGAVAQTEPYRDMIRILRADGSVMELLNIHTRTETNNCNPDTMASLYTGHYFVANEANAHGYGIVSYDSSQFIGPAWSTLAGSVIESYRYPLYPRVLKFFPGDGSTVIFREHLAPFGVSAYEDIESRSGGLWGHPSVFYLDEIRNNAGTIVEFKRSRHTSAGESTPTFKTTRGRAPVTSFTGHEISLSDKSMTIEALGRTTKIKFGVISRNGTALPSENMPYARLGGATDYAQEVAEYPENDARLYKSFTGYISEISDPENRVTKFSYESYAKRYRNTGFPHNNGSVTLSLNNYRLTSVTEPTARYVLSYYGNRDTTIVAGETRPKVLNNVIDSVMKFDADGTPLTTDVYAFDDNNLDDQTESWLYTTDHITGHTKQTRFLYENFSLNNYEPILTPGRHTVLKQTIETAGPVQTISTTAFRTAEQMPAWGGVGNYQVLPVSQITSINGITRSHQEFTYELDTLRDFWRTGELAATYGMEITRKVTRTLKPDEPSKVLLVDTTTYLHLPMPDSMLTWSTVRWNKLKSIANYFYLRDTLQHPDVVGKRWEEVSFRHPVAVFDQDSVHQHHIPPIFGLTEKSWITDTTGAVTGKRNVYLTDVLKDGEPAPRGVLVADSVLGSSSKSLLQGAYSYRREWTGHLLASKRNALGVETTYEYGQERCEDVPYWEECTIAPPVLGRIVASDGTNREHELTWSSFSYWFSKPATERQAVRRYDIAGKIYKDTLTSYDEQTYYGLSRGDVDANGFLSRFDYDYNGRLNVGWLPLDFAGTNIETLPPYEGVESADLFGTTHHQRRADILHCWQQHSGDSLLHFFEVFPGTVQETTHPDTLHARLPITMTPDCPCAPEFMPERKKGSRELQSVPCREEFLPYNEYATQKGYFGHLSHVLNANSPVKSATRIDSMTFEAMITSVDGTCVHLEVAIDSIFSQIFILSCSSGQGPEGDDPPGNGNKERDRNLQGVTATAGGYKLVVDLSEIAPLLAARPLGSTTTIELRVQTPGAGVAFINGTNADDLRPRLNVHGEYQKVWDRADYTIAYEHDDKNRTTTERAKIDDARHTMNDLAAQGVAVRRSMARTSFGADYRTTKTERTVIEPDSTRIDISRQAHTGLGAVMTNTDAEGHSIITKYDGANRPIETINTDGSRSTTAYIHARPDVLGIDDQEFFGYCDLTISTNEIGVKSARFTDAFGRVRREVTDFGSDPTNLNLTTRYDYDLFGRLMRVTNPEDQITTYTYDDFGRVLTRTQPDMGTMSYTYDALGNVRFMQDEEQASKNLLTFNQYDDLNRITVVGEAYIDEHGDCPPYNEDNPLAGGCGNGSRLTDRLNGNVLHVIGGSILTANRKMFVSPARTPSTFADINSFRLTDCDELLPEPRLGETEKPTLPLIAHPVTMYYPANGGIPGAPLSSFEDVAIYPEFVRMAVAYDTLPSRNGTAWKNFPAYSRWHQLAPTGQIRNQRGREAAVAYREKSSEAFHYAVMSFDERGRVEALLRYNENLGFDAVYYSYNSSNQVIAVTVADPVRKFTTWYGYDAQGRKDSVWTKLYPSGSGLITNGAFNSLRYPGVENRTGLSPEIVYSYTKLDRVARMQYPAIDVLVEYAYNRRKFLDSMTARRGGLPLFQQVLAYDPSERITMQGYRHGSGLQQEQHYGYDPAERLVSWQLGFESTVYEYDGVGNRLQVLPSNGPAEPYGYHPGTNRLWYRDRTNGLGHDTTHGYAYDATGTRTSHITSYNTPLESRLLQEEYFGYSFRGLLNRARVRKLTPQGIMGRWQDWRYRYSASGEREQKRMYPSTDGVVPAPDSSIYPWQYYLLGGGGQQLAVFHGQHLDSMQTECGDFNSHRVYLYPHEYLTYGAGDAALLITRPDGRREYRINDHLGSVRSVLNGNGTVIGTYDFEPFGTPLAATGIDSRKTFIDKELDDESTTYNMGVRQYDPSTGFTSIDPQWEQFRALTPYHYSFNNPLVYKDPNGEEPITAAIIFEGACTLYDIYDVASTVTDPEASGWDKGLTVAGAIIGLAAPGGGYGTAARKGAKVVEEIVEHADEVADAVKTVKKAGNAVKNGAKAADEATGGVYVLRRESDDAVMRSGRTNNFKRREKEHHNAEATKDYVFEIMYGTDNYKAQRGLEQRVHDTYKPPLNKINPISPKNPKKPEYMGEAKKYLEATQ